MARKRKTGKRAARPRGRATTAKIDKVEVDAVTGKRSYEPREDGLNYLLSQRKISRVEYRIGRKYGVVYREADLQDGPALRSCLDVDELVRGGKPSGIPAPDSGAAFIRAQARSELLLAREILNFHSGLIAAMDLVCGHQLRPREIAPEQRKADAIVEGLSTALQMLQIRGWGRPSSAA